jgi:hypothetical protein
MTRTVTFCAALLAVLFLSTRADTQILPRPKPAPPPTRFQPKLEAVAETKLLMEGLAMANFRGLDKLLRQRPDAADAWTFARGQALLVAETANLLMLRPPRNQGQLTWHERATELRDVATQLARHAGNRDYTRTKAAMYNLANSCNKCHQSFRVPVKLEPFAPEGGKSISVRAEL